MHERAFVHVPPQHRPRGCRAEVCTTRGPAGRRRAPMPPRAPPAAAAVAHKHASDTCTTTDLAHRSTPQHPLPGSTTHTSTFKHFHETKRPRARHRPTALCRLPHAHCLELPALLPTFARIVACLVSCIVFFLHYRARLTTRHNTCSLSHTYTTDLFPL